MLLAVLVADPARADPVANPSAKLFFFTDDGLASGSPLLPSFLLHSSWSALGSTSAGDVMIAVSNHQQPGGNVALFRFDPDADQMSLLGDIESISTDANNWMPNETQYKVHTFLSEHADGKMYFASMDHDPSPFLRGSHLYRVDSGTGVIEDLSKTAPFLLDKDLNLIPNPGTASEKSGVMIEFYGVKSLNLNPGAPDWLYAMTFPEGHLLQYNLSTGNIQAVGQSSAVGYVFYVDANGDVYYANSDDDAMIVFKYDASAMTTSTVASNLPSGELGALAPTAEGRFVYFMHANAKDVYRLDTQLDTFTFFADTCGPNFWRIYNLTLSPDERSLYYVSNNNNRSTIRRIDVATQNCEEVMDIDALLGSRNLSFGGIAVWDRAGRFYAPVWTHEGDPADVALLQVQVEEPALPVDTLPSDWMRLIMALGLAALLVRGYSSKRS